MKNPAYNGNRIYLARIGGKLHVIPVSFSRNRVATAWLGFSDTVLARASGYGYCKESTALADAVARLICDEYTEGTPEYIRERVKAIRATRGMGVEVTMRVACENGVELVDSYHYAIKRFTE